MRQAALLLLAGAAALAACKREPTFDERYDAAETRIRKTAEEIDAELQKSAPTPAPPTPAAADGNATDRDGAGDTRTGR